MIELNKEHGVVWDVREVSEGGLWDVLELGE